MALLLACGAASWAGEKENTDNQEVSEHKQVEESKRSAWNKYLHGYEYQARVAYNLGGTAPIGMPATIRTWMPITHSPVTGDSWEESASRTRA